VYMYICRCAWEWRDVVMMLRRNWMGWMDGWKEGMMPFRGTACHY
jgi:hypothetical protein